MSRVVISDTSPLRYLVLIGQADLLPALYTEVLIPEAVADELNQPATLDCPSAFLAPGGSTHRPARLGIAA
jgi:predicted nucleic acid-binding protein